MRNVRIDSSNDAYSDRRLDEFGFNVGLRQRFLSNDTPTNKQTTTKKPDEKESTMDFERNKQTSETETDCVRAYSAKFDHFVVQRLSGMGKTSSRKVKTNER
jgi:hypothetical protein